jgi:hypothetical protein
MKENSIDILKIIKETIDENELSNIGLNGGKAFTEFTKEDFTPFFKFVSLYGEKINVVKFISFCMSDFWYTLTKCIIKGNIWGKDFIHFNYLEVLIHKLNEIVISFDELFQKDRYDEAFSLYRNYIELSSILVASTLDEEFFNKYTSESESNSELIKLWFSDLKPKKVVEKLISLKVNVNNPFMEYTINHFTGNQREKLYSYTSSISHSNFSHIINTKKNEVNNISMMVIDNLVHSTLAIHLTNYNYLKYDSDKEERKLQIIAGIWIKILYGHLLK